MTGLEIIGVPVALAVVSAPVWVPLLVVYRAHKHNPSVQLMNTEELMAAGFTRKEAIEEQRAQRKEARDHARTMTNAVRAGVRAGHLARRITKRML